MLLQPLEGYREQHMMDIERKSPAILNRSLAFWETHLLYPTTFPVKYKPWLQCSAENCTENKPWEQRVLRTIMVVALVNIRSASVASIGDERCLLKQFSKHCASASWFPLSSEYLLFVFGQTTKPI